MQKRKKKRDILGRLRKISIEGLKLSRDLFPNWIGDHDFELSDYVGFLDRVNSREDLLRGLRQLDPFVDDALASAESMTDEEFPIFKNALAIERQIKSQLETEESIEQTPGKCVKSIMPDKFYSLLLPIRFIQGKLIADQFATSLEVAMGRTYYESELNE